MKTTFYILSSVTLSPPFKSCKRNKQLSVVKITTFLLEEIVSRAISYHS